MDIRVQANNVVYIDDYAHHPEEIRAVLTAVRELFPGVYLRVAFQPHLYTRTRDFASGFGQALEMADEVLIADIYPARESSIEGVTSHLIADHMKTVPVRVCAKEQVPQLLMQELPSPSVVMTLGAGDIDRCVSEVERLIQKVA
jgi:UDP-N-acetylmuramate--alanine ligase